MHAGLIESKHLTSPQRIIQDTHVVEMGQACNYSSSLSPTGGETFMTKLFEQMQEWYFNMHASIDTSKNDRSSIPQMTFTGLHL